MSHTCTRAVAAVVATFALPAAVGVAQNVVPQAGGTHVHYVEPAAQQASPSGAQIGRAHV